MNQVVAACLSGRPAQSSAFFHSDIAWRTNGRPTFLILARSFREEGIRFGVIIGGKPVDPTDVASSNLRSLN